MIAEGSYVKLEKDGMEAWLSLVAPEDVEAVYTKEEVIAYIKSNNVTLGIIESNIAAICKKRIYEREIKVAVGFPGKEGHSGYFEFFFEIDDTKKKEPRILPDGSVDYASINVLPTVKKGDILARYNPSEAGEDAQDVTGRIIKGKPVRDLRPLMGQGIVRKENEYYADKDGKIEYDGDIKLAIIEKHVIEGDVDFANYNKIEFYGDLEINGNVESGVIIRAGKSLTIEGAVGAATIYAGGSVTIKHGIQGNDKAKIICKGDLAADFIERAYVEAQGDVIANVILGSEIIADGHVKVTGKKGQLIGGYTHGTLGVWAMSVGNISELETIVHAGNVPELLDQRAELTQQHSNMNDALNDVAEEMVAVLRIRQLKGLTQTDEAHLYRLKKRKDELMEKDRQIKEDMAITAEKIEKGQGAVIHIEGRINRGTEIQIDKLQMKIIRETSFMEYKKESNLIQGSVIALN